MSRMPSATQAQHKFSTVEGPAVQRSSFNRSSGWKGTFDSGYLVPMFVDEVLPGDTFKLKSSFFARLATPLVPVMDNLYFETFYFFVPNRLLWTHWEQFNGYQANPGDSTSYLVPQIVNNSSTTFGEGSLADYFGIPAYVDGLSVNALHFRAYNLIWNEWFRDQNLQNSLTVDTSDGPDVTAYALQRRGKRHDYFTSCLPWTQKGTAVSIPIGTSAPVYAPATATAIPLYDMTSHASDTMGTTTVSQTPLNAFGGTLGQAHQIAFPPGLQVAGLYANLNSATAATINQLRQSVQLQAFYERDARGGTRYTEIIRAHFGVVSPDARLQRPEFLGGGSQKISTTPIPQTSGTGLTGQTTPQGNLAAMGVMSSGPQQGHGFVKSFVEHGVILGLCNVRADLNYQSGLHRMWQRQARTDFYWPAFARIGEQTVTNNEIYAVGSANPSQDAAAFGYQERYAEYRYKPSVITGYFNSNNSTPIDMWHLAQHFTALPVLNSTFISDTPPLSRVLAVGTSANGQQLICDAFHDLTCARPMPVFGTPASFFKF